MNAPGEQPKIVNPIIEEIDSSTSTPENINLSITGIELTELKTKSILTWDSVEDAESYNIYKKISENQIELIENISEPRYEIEIIGEGIKYEDFAIKAI
jgi:fibronectin type 3 domain-containing protein